MSIDLDIAAPGSLVAEYTTAPITREMLAQYAEASGDFNPLHLDSAFARQAGFDDVIAHGMLGMALLGKLLTDHFPASAILSYGARFVAIVPSGQSLHCQLRLEARAAGSAALSLAALLAGGTVAISGQARVAMAR